MSGQVAPSDRPVPEAVVVTGAAGWLGRNLVAALAGDRGQVRALVERDDEAAIVGLSGTSVEPVVGDVLDPSHLDRLFDGVAPGATVVHAAAVIHPRGRTRRLFDVNVGGTALVLDRSRRHGVGRLVHVSSNSPFGLNAHRDARFDERSPYARERMELARGPARRNHGALLSGRLADRLSSYEPYLAYGESKREAEELVLDAARRRDVDAVVVRPPWFYGPHQPERQTRWLRAVRRGRFPLVGDGTNRRSMVYAGNLVHGIVRAEAAGASGEAYWIADPQPYAMADVLDTVRGALEAEGLSVSGGQPRLPGFLGAMARQADGAAQRMGRYVQPLHVLGELGSTIACDVTRAQRELGYEPTTGLLDGMRASIRWCLDHGKEL